MTGSDGNHVLFFLLNPAGTTGCFIDRGIEGLNGLSVLHDREIDGHDGAANPMIDRPGYFFSKSLMDRMRETIADLGAIIFEMRSVRCS